MQDDSTSVNEGVMGGDGARVKRVAVSGNDAPKSKSVSVTVAVERKA